MGTPGARDPQTGLMKNCNTTELNGKPFVPNDHYARVLLKLD